MTVVYSKTFPGADYSGKAYELTNVFRTNKILDALTNERGERIAEEAVKGMEQQGLVPISVTVSTEDVDMFTTEWTVTSIGYPTKLSLVAPVVIAQAIAVLIGAAIALFGLKLISEIFSSAKEISYNVKETVVPMAWAFGLGIFALAAGYFVKHVVMPVKRPAVELGIPTVGY